MAAAAIKQRADEIRISGSYIGLFEWLAWGVFADASVNMLFGSTTVVLRDAIGPRLPLPSGDRVHRVGAVRARDGQWSAVRSGNLLEANHFVIGVEAIGVASAPGCDVGDCCAAKAAMRVGWLLKPGNPFGDCGPDCMAFAAGMPRTAETFQSIRAQLADFIVGVSDLPEWQEAFAVCGEGPGLDGSAVDDGLGPIAVGGLGPGGIDVESEEPSSPATPPHPGPCDDEAPLVNSPPPLPPPDGAPGDTLVVADSDASTPPRSFSGWLSSLTPEKRAAATASYFAFKAAEKDWLATKVEDNTLAASASPSKKHCSSSLTTRLETGQAYLTWLQGDGQASRSPLKDALPHLFATSA